MTPSTANLGTRIWALAKSSLMSGRTVVPQTFDNWQSFTWVMPANTQVRSYVEWQHLVLAYLTLVFRTALGQVSSLVVENLNAVQVLHMGLPLPPSIRHSLSACLLQCVAYPSGYDCTMKALKCSEIHVVSSG
jgi:hypothetical protein